MFVAWTVPEFRNPSNTNAQQQNSEQATGGNNQPVEATDLWDIYTSPKDTYAQWIAAFAALGSVGASVLAIVLVTQTLNETRKATNASIRSSEIAEETLLGVERPHLFITGTEPLVPITHEWVDLPDNQRPIPEAAYSVKNFGRTPAIINEIRASLRLCNLPATPHYHPGEINYVERVLGADDTLTPVAIDRGGPITNKILNELFLSDIHIEGRAPFRLYLYGEITYTSVNGITDQVGFVYRYSPYGPIFHLENIPGYTFRRRDVKNQVDRAPNGWRQAAGAG
ncbi:hypothetical protein [Mesorhizobium sp. L2C084A000]|uniref:hypothetical protein n=1 Tax=Mesorhizobium sp. L2C084A000 TaxID=1287116 RepID=UPI0012DCB1C2|nr:hypothetical protein [Mesorhizobium sp. L2C084A000]